GLCPAVYFLCTLVPEGDPALQVADEDRVVGKLEQVRLPSERLCPFADPLFELVMGLPEVLLHSLALGDIAENEHDARCLTIRVPYRRAAVVDGNLCSVLFL